MPRRGPSARLLAAALIAAVLLVGAAVVIVLVVTHGGARAPRRADPPAELEPAAKPTFSIDGDGITVESNGLKIDLRPPKGDREPEAEKGE